MTCAEAQIHAAEGKVFLKCDISGTSFNNKRGIFSFGKINRYFGRKKTETDMFIPRSVIHETYGQRAILNTHGMFHVFLFTADHYAHIVA